MARKKKDMFEIIKETELKDGTIRWEFEVNSEFKKIARIKYKKKRCTKELCNRLLVDILHDAGADFERQKLEKKIRKRYLKFLKLNNLKEEV